LFIKNTINQIQSNFSQIVYQHSIADKKIGILLSGGKDSYEYDATFSSARLIESKQSGTFSFGLMGVAGVEYFVLPRLSLGMEYTWGLSFASKTCWSSLTTRCVVVVSPSLVVKTGRSIASKQVDVRVEFDNLSCIFRVYTPKLNHTNILPIVLGKSWQMLNESSQVD
jgi:hypothetical protein